MRRAEPDGATPALHVRIVRSGLKAPGTWTNSNEAMLPEWGQPDDADQTMLTRRC